MENGLGSVETPNLVNKAMENDTMDFGVDEKAKAVSHESKNSEGDQVFEDSIAAEISSVYSENVISYPDDDFAKAENLHSSIDAHKKSDSEIDFEQFEEASEVPNDVDDKEKISASTEDNGEVFVGMQPVDKPKVAEINNEDGIMEKNEENVENDITAHVKTDSGVDFENFEEAVEVPVDVDNQEDKSVKFEDPVAVFLGVEPVDKPGVDEVNNGEAVMEKNEKDEIDSVDNVLVVHEKTDSRIDFESFLEAVEDPIEHDKPEDRLPTIENTREVPLGVNPVVEDVNIGDDVTGKNEASDITTVADDDKEIMKKEVVMEVDDAVVYDKEIQEDVIFEKHENGISDAIELEGKVASEISDNGRANVEQILLEEEPKTDRVESLDKAEESEQTKGISSSLVNGHEDKELFEEEGDAASGVEAKKKSITLNTKLEGEENCREIREEAVNSLHENGKNDETVNHLTDSEELRRDLASPLFDHQLTNGNPDSSVKEREETPEVKKTLTNGKPESSVEEREETPEVKKSLTNGNPESSVEEKEETSEIKTSPVFYDVAVEKAEAAQDNASDKVVDRANAEKTAESLIANTKSDEILEEKTKVDTKNTQDGNGPSEIKPVSDVFTTSTALPAVESFNADTKRDEIAGVTVEADKKNTRGKNGPSLPAPNTNVSVNHATPPACPAGLGRAAPLLETAPRVVSNVSNRANGTTSHVQRQVDDVPNGEAEEHDETREKLQMIRVKFLRLAHRLGQTPHNVVVAQVLYRLGLAEQLRGGSGGRVAGFSFDRASAMAEQLEANGQEPLDFSCTIMVLGKSGVGKSATINSIFDEVKFNTDAFQQGTKKVQDVVGTVQGIKVRVIDTPGLFPSWSDQRQNEKILLSVKRFIKKTPPDIVLYLDRLDMQTRDSGDMPLLRTITDVFGQGIWFNAIVVLTHAASAPPEGANGAATTYDMFVTNRSHVVQQAIRQAAGDARLMNPVSLVENHSACRKNRAGQRVLPNGQVWKPHLLLLSFASKILAEANTLLKLQDSPPGRPFPTRTRAPPLPFLLSSLLQSRPSLQLPQEQFGDDDVLGDDADELTDSEDEREYDELPPFKRLTKGQIGKLSKNQKKAYYDELEYREKLFMKKQLKEEKKRRKMMKKMSEMANETPSEYNDEEEGGAAASVPVPMPDLALPASFDSDNPTHRYRYLDSPNQWVVRPVLDSHGWDHDIGYEGINVEKLFVVKEKIPLSFSGQITKDKKDANMQMEVASSIKHGEGKSTSVGLDMQSLGKDRSYTLRSETKFMNFKKNKATAGISVTKLGDTISTGVKIEDQLVVSKRLKLVASAGAMTGRGDMAYGGSFEATLRDKDHPLGRSLTTLSLSVMDWHGDLAIGGNIQSQIPVGRSTNLIARANLSNKGSGQVSVRLNSSEQLQIVLVALIPLIQKVLGHVQMSQFGQ